MAGLFRISTPAVFFFKKKTREKDFNPFPNKPLFLRVCKLQEKIDGCTGRFDITEIMFKTELTLSQTSPVLRVGRKSPLKTLWEKEKLLVTSNFSFSHSVLYPFGNLTSILIKPPFHQI